jgi:hypothetical protein
MVELMSVGRPDKPGDDELGYVPRNLTSACG